MLGAGAAASARHRKGFEHLCLKGGGVVADTAYSKEHTMTKPCSTSPSACVFQTTLVSKAAPGSLAPTRAQKQAMSRSCSASPPPRELENNRGLEGGGVVTGTAYSINNML